MSWALGLVAFCRSTLQDRSKLWDQKKTKGKHRVCFVPAQAERRINIFFFTGELSISRVNIVFHGYFTQLHGYFTQLHGYFTRTCFGSTT